MPRLVILAAFLLTLAAQSQDRGALPRLLTFETEHPGGAPAGWSMSPQGSAVADGKIMRSGRWSVRVDRTATSGGPFSGVSMNIPLDVAGKQVTLRGFLRTEDVNGVVALWLREDGSSGGLGFDCTQSRQVKGTNDWQEHSVSVPIQAEGRQLAFGVLIQGTGKVWADDLELLVDGMPFLAAPTVERPKTIVETDREFDAGSRVAFDALNPAQIDNLTTLGKVWGFLKYHHPVVTTGTRHWDYDLFRVLPSVLAATDRSQANAALVKWVSRSRNRHSLQTMRGARVERSAFFSRPEVDLRRGAAGRGSQPAIAGDSRQPAGDRQPVLPLARSRCRQPDLPERAGVRYDQAARSGLSAPGSVSFLEHHSVLVPVSRRPR